MYVYWNVYYLAQTQYPCYLLLWLFFGLPPSLLLLPPPQLHVVITASWSITPSPWVTDCWNCFLVWFPFSPSYLLLKYFFGPLPLVTHCWNCFLNTFPQLPVSWPPPPPVTCCWNCFLFHNPSPLVTCCWNCFLPPLPLQLPAVGTFYPPTLTPSPVTCCWNCFLVCSVLLRVSLILSSPVSNSALSFSAFSYLDSSLEWVFVNSVKY